MAFAAASLVPPFSRNLDMLLLLQFVAGLASGCFIPLTLSFVLRNIPHRLCAYGVALYALNLELSLNISASLEGWYIENLSWHWIFWQSVPLALGMTACLHFGIQSTAAAPPRIHNDRYLIEQTSARQPAARELADATDASARLMPQLLVMLRDGQERRIEA